MGLSLSRKLARNSDGEVAADLLETISATLNDALALSDAQGQVLAVNDAYQELYGFAEAELVGHSFSLIFAEDQRAEAERQYCEVFQNQAPPVHRASIRRADGTHRRVESRIAFVERGHGRIAMLSAIHDLSAHQSPQTPARALPTTLDVEMLEGLYESYVRPALGYAHALLGDAEQAERVVEETLLSIWRAGLAHEADDSAARPLLFGILRRTAGQALLSRIQMRRTAGSPVTDGRSIDRWWARLEP